MKSIDVYARDGSVKGSFTVDDEDYERVSAHKWCFNVDGYPCNTKLGRLSRWLLACTDPGIYVDHINGQVTDNRRCNLRLATPSLNVHNRKRPLKDTNRFVGVSYNPRAQKYYVRVGRISYGSYVDEEHAARVYNHYAVLKWGKDAKLNDLPDDPNFQPPREPQRRVQRGEGTVYFEPKSEKWKCSVGIDGVRHHLGSFPTKEKAAEVLARFRAEHEQRKESIHLTTPIARNEDGIAVIPIKFGQAVRQALVDDDVWHTLMKRAWCYAENHYVTCGVNMHHLVMKDQRLAGMVIDHINGNRLDNRKCNLRVATHSQNAQNRTLKVERELPRGVCRAKNGKFNARINCKGRYYGLGTFNSPEAAAKVYDTKARELYGPHAKTNNPVIIA